MGYLLVRLAAAQTMCPSQCSGQRGRTIQLVRVYFSSCYKWLFSVWKASDSLFVLLCSNVWKMLSLLALASQELFSYCFSSWMLISQKTTSMLSPLFYIKNNKYLSMPKNYLFIFKQAEWTQNLVKMWILLSLCLTYYKSWSGKSTLFKEFRLEQWDRYISPIPTWHIIVQSERREMSLWKYLGESLGRLCSSTFPCSVPAEQLGKEAWCIKP